MPAGKTHEKINAVFIHSFIFVSLLLACYIGFGWIGFTCILLFVIGYGVGTYYLGPDLDLPSRPYYRWRFLRFLWKPYQKWFAHRSFWTHSYVISDLIRFLYVASWFLPPCFVLAFFFPIEWVAFRLLVIAFIQEHGLEISLFLVGIMTASALHIAADQLSTAHKKRKKRKKRNA